MRRLPRLPRLLAAALGVRPRAAGLPTTDCCLPPDFGLRCEDGTAATPCCAYGACSAGLPLCCDCDEGCRSLWPPADCAEVAAPVSMACRMVSRADGGNFTVEDCEDEGQVYNASQEVPLPGDALGKLLPQARANLTARALVYDFGPARITLTAAEVGPGGQAFGLAHSPDGGRWWSDGRYVSRGEGGPVRLHSGRVTTRHVLMLHEVNGASPIADAWLVGCPVAEGSAAMSPNALFSRQVREVLAALVQAAVAAAVAAGLCACAVVLAWRRQRRWRQCRAREAQVLTEVPLLPPPGGTSPCEERASPAQTFAGALSSLSPLASVAAEGGEWRMLSR